MRNVNASNGFGIRLLALVIALAILPAAGGTAYAISDYLSAFNGTYGTAGTALNTCNVCHTTIPARNPYGAAFAANAHNFATIEPLDSDGDGFTNLTEINARTFPGDPASFPAGVDNTPPTVVTTVPDNNATGVTSSIVTVTFSEPILPASVTDNTFFVRRGVDNVAVAGTRSVSGAIVTFTPATTLADNTTYTWTLTTGITDLAGNALAANQTRTFTTGTVAAPPPVVVSSDDGGGCAMTGTRGGDIKELAGTYGFLMLVALGMALRGSVKRKEK